MSALGFYALISSKDRDYSVTGHFEKAFNLERYIPVFEQMLHTFHSLSETQVTIFRNDTYDFAISIPVSWSDVKEMNPIPKTSSDC